MFAVQTEKKVYIQLYIDMGNIWATFLFVSVLVLQSISLKHTDR